MTKNYEPPWSEMSKSYQLLLQGITVRKDRKVNLTRTAADLCRFDITLNCTFPAHTRQTVQNDEKLQPHPFQILVCDEHKLCPPLSATLTHLEDTLSPTVHLHQAPVALNTIRALDHRVVDETLFLLKTPPCPASPYDISLDAYSFLTQRRARH